MSAMNHSAELKPRIPTPWQRCKPSCGRETERFLRRRGLLLAVRNSKPMSRWYLQEALGGGAAELVVLPVAQAAAPLPVLPAQRRVASEALHGRGERLVDGQRRLGGQAGLSHPQLHLSVSPGGPQGGRPCCRQRQRVWPLSFLYRKNRKIKKKYINKNQSNEGLNPDLDELILRLDRQLRGLSVRWCQIAGGGTKLNYVSEQTRTQPSANTQADGSAARISRMRLQPRLRSEPRSTPAQYPGITLLQIYRSRHASCEKVFMYFRFA